MRTILLRYSVSLKRSVVTLAVFVLAASVAAAADQVVERRTVPEGALTEQQPETLDRLLGDLKRERDPEQASSIANRAVAHWTDSDSATIDLLMQWADAAITEKRNGAALDFLDQAITLSPDFVGAWNRRATLHYTMGSYRKSMADINHVLSLEPRHFGALAGMAAILSESGNDALAMKAWERYLEIYPADREAQDVVSKLSEKLAGNRT